MSLRGRLRRPLRGAYRRLCRRLHSKKVDWSVFNALNGLMRHDSLEDVVEVFAAVSVIAYGIAALGLWLGDRPGGPLRWRLATTTAFAAAGIGLLVSQVISHLWDRPRPYQTHPHTTILVTGPNPDPSFPSDHATAAFAIAFAVYFFSRRAGIVFLVGATAIALSRIFVGLHYPTDVLGGAAIGFGSALVLRRPLTWVTAGVARLTDPLLRPLWALVARARARRRESLPPSPDAGSL